MLAPSDDDADAHAAAYLWPWTCAAARLSLSKVCTLAAAVFLNRSRLIVPISTTTAPPFYLSTSLLPRPL
jgi:hypothetical protein